MICGSVNRVSSRWSSSRPRPHDSTPIFLNPTLRQSAISHVPDGMLEMKRAHHLRADRPDERFEGRLLTALPDLAAPLAELGTFFYGLVLLFVVLLVPRGLRPGVRAVGRAVSLDAHGARRSRTRFRTWHVRSAPVLHPDGLTRDRPTKRFGGIVALEEVSLDVAQGEVHDRTAAVKPRCSTCSRAIIERRRFDSHRRRGPHPRAGWTTAASGDVRTFQTPRLLSGLSVLQNAILGGWSNARAGIVETAFALGRLRREERATRERAPDLLVGVGLGAHLDRRVGIARTCRTRASAAL